MTLEALIFDLDGTLIEFAIDYVKARKIAQQHLIDSGAPVEFLDLSTPIFTMADRAAQYFENTLKMTQKAIDNIMDELNLKVIEVEKEAAERAKIMRGMDKVLAFIQAKNLPIAVCTLNTTPVAYLSLEKAGLLRKFPDMFSVDRIFGRDKVGKRTKPDPFHHQVAIDSLEVLAENVVAIGDHPMDCLTAHKVGARSIGILRGNHPASDYQADYLVKMDEIAEKIPKIFSSHL